MLRDYRWILSILLRINASSGLELWQKHIRSHNLGHDPKLTNFSHLKLIHRNYLELINRMRSAIKQTEYEDLIYKVPWIRSA